VAAVLAPKEGIDSFTAKHLEAIRFLREYFLHHSVFPLVSAVCRSTPQARRCVHERFMTFLEQAWNIAGVSHQDSSRSLSQRDEQHPKEPVAVQEQSPQHT